MSTEKEQSFIKDIWDNLCKSRDLPDGIFRAERNFLSAFFMTYLCFY